MKISKFGIFLLTRRAGFCYRNTFQKFLKRYAVVSPKTFPTWNGSPTDGIREIMSAVNMDPKEWQLGREKIFVKAPESLFLLEESRDRKYHTCAKIIQRAYRKHHAQKYFIDLRKKSAEVMYNKKERNRYSLNRVFLGDYLNVLDNPVMKVLIEKQKSMFSSQITKYDRKFNAVNRELVLTDTHLFIIGAEEVKKGPTKGQFVKIVKRKLAYKEIKSVDLRY
jgi:myosin-1